MSEEIKLTEDISVGDFNGVDYVQYFIIFLILFLIVFFIEIILRRLLKKKLEKWLKNAITTPLLIQIIFPSIIIIVIVSLDEIAIYLNETFSLDLVLAYLIAFNVPFFLYMMYAVPYFNRPFATPAGEYFKKYGYEKTVIEYNFIKKITYVSFILVILSIFLFYSYEIINPEDEPHDTIQIILAIGVAAGTVSYISFVRLGSHLISKEFRFHYARGCMRIALKQKQEYKKIQYAVAAIDSYDKFLDRHIKHKLNYVAKIVSNLSIDSEKMNEENLKKMAQAFEETELKPLSYFKTLLNIETTESILMKTSFAEKLRVWFPIILAIIASTVSIVNYVIANIEV